jgi:DNA polymerase-1
MIKRAMIAVDAELQRKAMGSRMLLQVHDELLFEVPEEEVAASKALVVRHMQDALPLSVPVEVEVGTGRNWLEAH